MGAVNELRQVAAGLVVVTLGSVAAAQDGLPLEGLPGQEPSVSVSAHAPALESGLAGLWSVSGEDRRGRYQGQLLVGAPDAAGRCALAGVRVYADGVVRTLAGEGYVSAGRLAFEATLSTSVGIAGRLRGDRRTKPLNLSGSYRLAPAGNQAQGAWDTQGSQRGSERLERAPAAAQGEALADADRELAALAAEATALFAGLRAELLTNIRLEDRLPAMLARRDRVAARNLAAKDALVGEANALRARIDRALTGQELTPEQRSALKLRRHAADGWTARIEARWADELAQAERFARRRVGVGDWVVEKRPAAPLKPEDTDHWLRDTYNETLTRGLNDLRKKDLDPKLAKEIDRLVTKELPDEVPESYRKAVAAELARVVVEHPHTTNVTNALENFLVDLSDFLYAEATFHRVRAEEQDRGASTERRAGVRSAGTEAPSGGDSASAPASRTTAAPATGDAVAPPAGRELAAAKAEVKARADVVAKSAWKIRNEFKLDLKPVWDASLLMVKRLSLEEAVLLEREGGFKGRAYVRANVAAPLTADASLTLTTGATAKGGGFEAYVRNTTTVTSLYTDPTVGGTTELALGVAYESKPLTASVDGKVDLPLGDPAAEVTYDVKASLSYRPTDAVVLSASGHVRGAADQPAAWAFKPSASYRFAEPWTATAAGSLEGVGEAPPRYGFDLGLTYRPEPNAVLSLTGGLSGNGREQPEFHGKVKFTYRY